MNSFVSVDKEEDEFSFHGDQIKSDDESPNGGDSCSSSGGSVVLLLPKDNVVMEASEDEASPDIIPITVDNIPVYLSRSVDGTPLFIRRFPPTMEELLLTSPDEMTPSFDGFSEASGSTFEGFSEASRCSSAGSATFEGFSDDLACGKEEETGGPRKQSVMETLEVDRHLPLFSLKKRRKNTRQMTRISTENEAIKTEAPVEEKTETDDEEVFTSVKTRKRTRSRVSTDNTKVDSPKKKAEQQTSDTFPQVSGLDVKTEKERSVQQKRADASKTPPRTSKRVRASVSYSDMGSDITTAPSTVLDIKPEDDFIGKYCSQIGCTISWLESLRTMFAKITNGIVYELDEFASRIAWERDYVAVWILRMSGCVGVFPTAEDHAKIRVILKRRKALKVTLAGQKFACAKLQEFDETQFILPTASKGKAHEKWNDKGVANEGNEEQVLKSVSPRVNEAYGTENMDIKSESEEEEDDDDDDVADYYTTDEDVHTTSPQVPKNLDMTEERDNTVTSPNRSTSQTPASGDDTAVLDAGQSSQSMQGTVEKKEGNSTLKGTLGVSKSGRIRKPSAKGSVSIEFKYLFMEKQGPFTAPSTAGVSSQESDDVEEPKRKGPKSKVNQSPGRKSSDEKESLSKGKFLIGPRHLNKYIDMENTRVAFTLEEGRVIPQFKELDYNLGPRCNAVGLTVGDLNTKERLHIKINNGIIKELFDFYISRGSTLTSLACRLFWMYGAPHDPTRILSTISKIGVIGRTMQEDHPRANRLFTIPQKQLYGLQRPVVKTLQSKIKKSSKILKGFKKVKQKTLEAKLKQQTKTQGRKRGRKKKEVKPTQDTTPLQEDPLTLDEDVMKTRGREGSITRGDIVHLYTQWLRNKRKLGSNVFVTDLLKDVEQLMAERQVESIRVPAGTLMSSSVKLYDEYKQMCIINKDDAIMYLEDDWLEDIQYLVSISQPSRRNTMEGDSTGSKTDLEEATIPQDAVEGVSDSDNSERNLIIDEDSDNGKIQSNLQAKKSSLLHSTTADGLASSGSIKKEERAVRKTRKNISYNKDSFGDYIEEEDSSKNDDKMLKKQSSGSASLKVQTGKLTKPEDVANSTLSNAVSILPEEDYEVEKIIDFRYVMVDKKERLEYLVRWLGFTEDEDCWVDEKDLQCPEILKDFWYAEDFVPKTPRKTKMGSKATMRSKSQVSPTSNSSSSDKEEDATKVPQLLGQRKRRSDKENGCNMLEVLMGHTTMKKVSTSRVKYKNLRSQGQVTIRDVLDLYDTWRRENTNVLMAGGSNTVNLEVLVKRVKKLMLANNVDQFYPESLLNACFLMTLMKMRLKSEEVLNNFLDSNCLDILETSHKQQLVTREKHKSGDAGPKTATSHKTMSVVNLQKELQAYKCDLTLAEGMRSDSNSALSLVKNEVECLVTICRDSQNQNKDITSCVQKELKKVKENAKKAEAERKSKRRTIVLEKKGSEGKIAVDRGHIRSKSENGLLEARKELIKYGIKDKEVGKVMELVIHKIGGHGLRARPQQAAISKTILTSK